jgi:hypothetical protein
MILPILASHIAEMTGARLHAQLFVKMNFLSGLAWNCEPPYLGLK